MTPKRLVVALAVLLSPLLLANSAWGQNYEVPPSSSTSSFVPYISDAAMEQCVILYNKAKWLGEEIGRTQVNQYDGAAVEAYNNKVNSHTSMLSVFNSNCAGKQSESAYRAAQELNKRNSTRRNPKAQ